MAKLFSRLTAAAAALCAALFGAGCSGDNPVGNEPVDVYGPPDPEPYETVYGPPEWFGEQVDEGDDAVPEPLYGPPEWFEGEQAQPSGQ